MEERPTLKAGIEWVDVEVTGEPTVLMTFRGYAPVLPVKTPDGDQYLYISSKSMSEGLEPLRESNGGKFVGLKFGVRKAGTEKFDPYEIQPKNGESE